MIQDSGERMTRKELLDKAAQCVCQDRESQYGPPEDNFDGIAEFWNTYDRVRFRATGRDYDNAHDVAIKQDLVKIARIASGQIKADNYIDLAGYAVCAGEIALKDLPVAEKEEAEEECCGSCEHFEFEGENSSGFGYCDKKDSIVWCESYCKRLCDSFERREEAQNG